MTFLTFNMPSTYYSWVSKTAVRPPGLKVRGYLAVA